MDHDQHKIEQIRSLDPNHADISPQLGLCRFEPGEDAAVRRAKMEKVLEAFHARQTRTSIDGFVPAQAVDHDGEYVATRQEGRVQLHCVAWRDHGHWRRLSDWSEQKPESSHPHAEILFAPEPGRLLVPPGQWPV